MEPNTFNLNDKIYSNNNNILLEIVNDLQKIVNYSKDDLLIKMLGNVIIKMNNMINENKKNTDLIRNDISKLYDKIKTQFEALKINNSSNNIKHQELISEHGRYIGQVVNGLREGKGIYYINNGNIYDGEWKKDKREGKGTMIFNNGDKYEGDFKNGQAEGKGINYYQNGDRYEGDFITGQREGKGVYYYQNGNRYEGDYKNDNPEGKGIMYYNNGDRMMGDYSNDEPIGKHVILTKNGEIKNKNY